MTSVLAIWYRANRQTFFCILHSRGDRSRRLAVSHCERVVVKITAEVLSRRMFGSRLGSLWTPTLTEVDDETEGVIRKIQDIAKQGVETPLKRGEICHDDFQAIDKSDQVNSS